MRLQFLDFAKGLGIIIVVLGHLIIPDYLRRLIFSFHMPLFFIISGYFFSKLDTKTFIAKKFKQLIKPYIITCFITVVLSVIIAISTGNEDFLNVGFEWIKAGMYGSGIDYEKPFHIKNIGAIWFLLALFWGSVLLNYAVRTRYALLFIFFNIVAGMYTIRFFLVSVINCCPAN